MGQHKQLKMWQISTLFSLLMASALTMKYLSTPFVWISVGWFFLFLYYGLSFQQQRNKMICVYLAVFVAVFGSAETYLLLIDENPQKEIHREGTVTKNYIIAHDVLGYAVPSGGVFTSRQHINNKLIYDVTYTIDDNGCRTSPPVKNKEIHNSILFFGGSFTFGEGVQDHETMPYQAGVLLEDKYAVYNFGLHGYGAHQMLAAIQHGIVDEVIQQAPAHVFYLALPDHVNRVAGFSSWDTHGPQYKLRENGTVWRDGHFDDNHTQAPSWITFQLTKSQLISQLFYPAPVVQQAHIDLYAAVVQESQKNIQKKYPKTFFHVILWDDLHYPHVEKIKSQLEERGLSVLFASKALPDLNDEVKSTKYKIEGDGHPNAYAYNLLAQMIAQIVQDK